MLIAMTTFPNDGRKLKQLIQWLVRWGIASCVQRINYVKSYYMREWAFKKEEEKILIIKFPKENKEQLTSFLKKNHPYQVPELVFLAPEDVDKVYLERVQSQAKKPGKK